MIPILLLCSFGCAATCPKGQAKDQTTLIQVERTWVGAEAKHDVAALGCILADDFEEVSPNGSLIDRSAILANAAKPHDDHYEVSDMHAHIYGDFAYVRGKSVKNDNGVHMDKARFTDVFVYRDGRWRCVAGHESNFPEARKGTHPILQDAHILGGKFVMQVARSGK